MLSLRLTFVNTAVFSVFASFLIQKANVFPSRTPSFLSGASLILFLISALRLTWGCYIYPHYRSPLRHLPKPPDRPSLLMGHFFQMMEGNPGVVLRSWTNTLQQSNLIRYLDFLNLERVVPITPAALADVLVHKCYDFEKPAELRKGISRILGLGLFLAEGDVHKVNRHIHWAILI